MTEAGDGVPPRLFTPGPTQLPEAVYRAAARAMVPARSDEFMAIMASIAGRLRRVFLTAGDVFTTEQIEGYMELKWEEVYRFEHSPHPVEFDLYYSV